MQIMFSNLKVGSMPTSSCIFLLCQKQEVTKHFSSCKNGDQQVETLLCLLSPPSSVKYDVQAINTIENSVSVIAQFFTFHRYKGCPFQRGYLSLGWITWAYNYNNIHVLIPAIKVTYLAISIDVLFCAVVSL